MEFKEGIYENLDYTTYDSIQAWRSHDLTDISKCPFTWKHKVFDSESPALLEGRVQHTVCLLYTSPSPRDGLLSRMPSSA